MADVKIKWNMGEFVRIANAVNAELCAPAAAKVAAAARDDHHPEYGPFVHTTTDPRSGLGDWAHTRVVSAHPHAMTIESKHGVLGRALGSA